MNQKTVREVFDARLSGLEVTEKQKNSILQRIAAEQAGAAPEHYAGRLSFVSILTMVLMAAMLTAAIAVGARYGVFDFMGHILGEANVLPQATELLQTNLGVLDLPHTTITAEEAVYDGGSLQVVYSIEAKNLSRKPTENDLDNPLLGLNNPNSEFSKALAADAIYYYAGFDSFRIDGIEYPMTNGSFGDALFDEANGKIYCYMNMQLASAGIFPPVDFTVGLPVAGKTWRDQKLLEFAVKSNVAQGVKAVRETECEIITVHCIFVTPIRIYVSLRVEIKEGTSPEKAEALLLEWQQASLFDTDGNAISDPMEMRLENIENRSIIDYHYTFPPIDLAEVYFAPTTMDDAGNQVRVADKAMSVSRLMPADVVEICFVPITMDDAENRGIITEITMRVE